MVTAPVGPESDGGFTLALEDVARLVADVSVCVYAYPRSDGHPCHDDWTLAIEPLGLWHSDVGLDAALIGLTERAAQRVRGLLADADERHRQLPLLLRLYLAERDGSLGRLLERSTHLVRWEGSVTDRHSPGR